MKWMGWSPDDLAMAPPEMIDEIIVLMKEEQKQLEELNAR